MPEWLAKVGELAVELMIKSNQALYDLALTNPRDFWAFWAKNTEGLYHLAWIVGGAIGIPLLYIRTRAADRSADAALEQAKAALKQSETAAERHKQQTDADRERRITESFAKAVEQLGNTKLEVRLGGIYTLERIARESEDDYWPIMETLTAYVRERAPWPPKSSAEDEAAGESETETRPPSEIRPKTDIQAVLTVLGRRGETARQRDQAANRHLDLMRTDLRGANLVKAHLEGAILGDAHLEGADLRKAHLEDADLRYAAHLKCADLREAHLERANLEGACLEDARLWRAHLEGAWLGSAWCKEAHFGEAHMEGTELGGASLEGAYLARAKNLTQEQVDAAMGDARTELPEGFTRPAYWLKTGADDEDAPER